MPEKAKFVKYTILLACVRTLTAFYQRSFSGDFGKIHSKGSEKVQNCALYVGAQFIEPDDNGFR
jgi:hypothetical protein